MLGNVGRLSLKGQAWDSARSYVAEVDSYRDTELTSLFKRLYEDNVLGRVTNEQFCMLSADYNDDQKVLRDAIPAKETRLQKLTNSASNVDSFIDKAKRYTEIQVKVFLEAMETLKRTPENPGGVSYSDTTPPGSLLFKH
jgi:hypothetical protein